MVINTLYSKYFQKSKIFLYPLLGIKRGTSVVPSETYVSWENKYGPGDMKLVCLYTRRSDAEYEAFENNVLLKHARLYDYIKVSDKESVFVFDFSDLKSDWENFTNGNYSRFTPTVKGKILDFFEKYSGNYIYIFSYLNPTKWFAKYAEILDVDVKLLEEVGELCDKPDLDKEKLLILVADLENIRILD
jgi:hypothetical protein